jgi:hypothetical protein
MANTYVDYTATASQTDFAFSFDYLEDEHVTVSIDGVATTDFTIVTTPSTKIVLDTGATAGQIVRVRRKSQPDTDLVDFVNGSILTESELDRAYRHNRYLAEEISELNDASLQRKEGSQDFSAQNQKLKDLADPVDAQDATTKNYVDTADALKVDKAGDSMTGALAMGGNKITGLGTPTATADASTKDYVDAKVNQVSSGASSPPTKWVFTGDAGANTTYDVTGAEVNGDTAYDVSIDGSVLEPTTDYTVDPDTDTLTIISTLIGGEDIVVIERGFGIAITTGTISGSQITNGAVSVDKLAANAVTSAKIEDGAVTSAKIEDGAVTAVKISTTDPIFNVQSNGRVGIGTNNPAGDIHAVGTLYTDILSLNISGNTTDAELNSGSGTYGIQFKSGLIDTAYLNNVGLGVGTSVLNHRLEVAGDVNVTGAYKVNGAVLLLDEDAMTSNSDTQTATQQSIKAYVDSQVSQVSQVLNKYDTGWVDQDDQLTPVSVGNGATMVFNHGLGSDALASVFSVYAAESATGTNMEAQEFEFYETSSASDIPRGIQIKSITATQVTIQLGGAGYSVTSAGNYGSKNWGTSASQFSHVRLVLIA